MATLSSLVEAFITFKVINCASKFSVEERAKLAASSWCLFYILGSQTRRGRMTLIIKGWRFLIEFVSSIRVSVVYYLAFHSPTHTHLHCTVSFLLSSLTCQFHRCMLFEISHNTQMMPLEQQIYQGYISDWKRAARLIWTFKRGEKNCSHHLKRKLSAFFSNLNIKNI